MQQLRKERGNKYKLTIRWIAGHEGADEKADREAKKAANGQSSVKSTLPKYLRKGIKSSVSARKQKREEGLNKAGKRSGSRQSDTRDSRQKDISVPSSKKYIEPTSEHRLTRQMTSLIFQLRTGHASLNEYLHRFRKVDSSRCPACGEARENCRALRAALPQIRARALGTLKAHARRKREPNRHTSKPEDHTPTRQPCGSNGKAGSRTPANGATSGVNATERAQCIWEERRRASGEEKGGGKG